MEQSHVLSFGGWEGGENEMARKDQTAGGKIADAIRPEENPDKNATDERSSGGRVELEEPTAEEVVKQAYNGQTVNPAKNATDACSSGGRADLEQPTGEEAVKQAYDGQRSREDGEVKQFANFPARGNGLDPQRHGAGGASPGEMPKYVMRQSVDSEHSEEKSPLHPQARISGRGSAAAVPSPAREGKVLYDSIQGTPGRSILGPKSEDSPDKGAAAVPIFGDWDENNPAAADGYSYIFKKIHEERQNAAVIGAPTESSNSNAGRQTSASFKSCCGCFPWK